MFPNGDFAYDSVNQKFYAVNDYSPAPTNPSVADAFELAYIAEEELYTTEAGEGWVSVEYNDWLDLGHGIDYERAYSACIVSDMYGHMLEGNVEVVYNNCKTGSDYLYTQHFVSKIYE